MPARLARAARAVAVLLQILLIVVVGATAVVAARAHDRYHRPLEEQARTQGGNALWADHAWVTDSRPPAAYRRLARTLREGRITDVFFHAGPLQADGSVAPRGIGNAGALVAALADVAPDVRPQAWLQRVDGDGALDLGDRGTRAAIAATARRFLDLGFRGIHYDLHPIDPGDRGFLELLDRTRRLTRGRDAVVSVATTYLEPFGGASALGRLVSDGVQLWTEDYYAEVGPRVDQVALMTHRLRLPTEYLYGWSVEAQTRALLDVLPGEVPLLVGVPTFDPRPRAPGRNPQNLRSAIAGVHRGLEDAERWQRRKTGLAIYAEWSTEPVEWRTYRSLWTEAPGA